MQGETGANALLMDNSNNFKEKLKKYLYILTKCYIINLRKRFRKTVKEMYSKLKRL